jgi:hypothetical protein
VVRQPLYFSCSAAFENAPHINAMPNIDRRLLANARAKKHPGNTMERFFARLH